MTSRKPHEKSRRQNKHNKYKQRSGFESSTSEDDVSDNNNPRFYNICGGSSASSASSATGDPFFTDDRAKNYMHVPYGTAMPEDTLEDSDSSLAQMAHNFRRPSLRQTNKRISVSSVNISEIKQVESFASTVTSKHTGEDCADSVTSSTSSHSSTEMKKKTRRKTTASNMPEKRISNDKKSRKISDSNITSLYKSVPCIQTLSPSPPKHKKTNNFMIDKRKKFRQFTQSHDECFIRDKLPPHIDIISPSPTLSQLSSCFNRKPLTPIPTKDGDSPRTLTPCTPTPMLSPFGGGCLSSCSSLDTLSPMSRSASSHSGGSDGPPSPLPPIRGTPKLRRSNLLPPLHLTNISYQNKLGIQRDNDQAQKDMADAAKTRAELLMADGKNRTSQNFLNRPNVERFFNSQHSVNEQASDLLKEMKHLNIDDDNLHTGRHTNSESRNFNNKQLTKNYLIGPLNVKDKKGTNDVYIPKYKQPSDLEPSLNDLDSEHGITNALSALNNERPDRSRGSSDQKKQLKEKKKRKKSTSVKHAHLIDNSNEKGDEITEESEIFKPHSQSKKPLEDNFNIKQGRSLAKCSTKRQSPICLETVKQNRAISGKRYEDMGSPGSSNGGTDMYKQRRGRTSSKSSYSDLSPASCSSTAGSLEVCVPEGCPESPDSGEKLVLPHIDLGARNTQQPKGKLRMKSDTQVAIQSRVPTHKERDRNSLDSKLKTKARRLGSIDDPTASVSPRRSSKSFSNYKISK